MPKRHGREDLCRRDREVFEAFGTEDRHHYPGEARGLPVLTIHRALQRALDRLAEV